MGIERGWVAPAIRRWPPAWIFFLVGVLLSTGSTPTGAAPDQNAAPEPPLTAAAPALRPSEHIPVTKVAPAATEVAQQLRRLASDLSPGDDIQAISKALPAVSAKLETDLKRALTVLQDQPSLEGLQTQEQYWYNRQIDLTAWLSTLTDRVTRLQESLTQLEGLRSTWTMTREAAQQTGAPAAVLQQIDDTLTAVAAAMPLYSAQRDAALDLQGQIAREVARCETARTRIQEVQQGTASGSIFGGTTHPLWSPALWTQGLAALPVRLPQIAAAYWPQVLEYLQNPAKHLPLHLWFFVLTLIALLTARVKVRHWAAEGHDVSRIAVVFDRPLSAAMLVWLILATSILSSTPPGVKDLMGAVAVVPLIVLARPLLSPAIRPALYVLGLLYALDRVRHAFVGTIPWVDQTIVFAGSLAGGIALVWLLRHRRAQRRQTAGAPAGMHWAWRLMASVALILLAIGLVASLFGSLQLARLTTPAVLVGGEAALWLYAFVKVATAVIAFAFRVWPLKHLHLVQNHRERLVSLIQRGLLWIAITAWWIRLLDYLGLWESTKAGVEEALAARLALGAFSTSAGDVLAFAITLWAAYRLSVALRFLLEEDVYPRTGISQGISYAATSLLRYTIGVLAVFIGLGFLGVTLTQVTVFAGALGVGVGFGLQDVVKNFISGLILLFEHPIHVGDAVQIGELQGRVRRIGIRASIVRTVQGAEVIIPNSELTAKQVTNWTLTDQQRRLDLTVNLSYGSEPEQVIALLEGIARAHPRVLSEPPPCALFTHYGDNAILFELRVWTDYAITNQVRSELATAIYKAVYAAGMTFPAMEREVLLLAEGSAMPPRPARP